MVYLATPEDWQRQSSLLLQARPTTARITTKYKIPNLESSKYQKALKRKRDTETGEKDNAAPKVPKGSLVLKTYDPESGVVLKFKTDKAADVGRLIGGLGRLGRHMAALPESTEGECTLPSATWSQLTEFNKDAVMEDAGAPEPTTADSSRTAKAGPSSDSKPQQAPAGSGSGGGGKKKKKGKK
ncbi:hypothetical protein LTR78_000562 [Recurvomyces mirabilis]|uniref:SRP9 domain-containing protein n=1 Tax=Recurvomyces mirabilis TaxID=574656 RepID=A0AAE0WYI8_9PEZI|nr:hypothetical protein LTR78_000562 [Recurvomyces mirabilis]KAK5162216.1 hypothetical protein LTS14_000562 [Recurvomyces mirabilis]